MNKTIFFLLTHEFNNGRQVLLFSTYAKAQEVYKAILVEYKNDGYELNVDAQNDSELNEATSGDSSLVIEEIELDQNLTEADPRGG
jgi:hypothetical protein